MEYTYGYKKFALAYLAAKHGLTATEWLNARKRPMRLLRECVQRWEKRGCVEREINALGIHCAVVNSAVYALDYYLAQKL